MRSGIGILGGSFDPPHNGHVDIVCGALSVGLGRVLVIPAAVPPHKLLSGGATPERRLEMTRLAFAGMPGVEVSDIELRRPGKSYTVDTLRELKESYPETALYLLMGADMLMTIESWHDFEGIVKLAGIIAFRRGRVSRDELEAHARHINLAYGAKCLCAGFEARQVSSTQIRAAIASGEDVSGLVPDAVHKYLANLKIYR